MRTPTRVPGMYLKQCSTSKETNWWIKVTTVLSAQAWSTIKLIYNASESFQLLMSCELLQQENNFHILNDLKQVWSLKKSFPKQNRQINHIYHSLFAVQSFWKVKLLLNTYRASLVRIMKCKLVSFLRVIPVFKSVFFNILLTPLLAFRKLLQSTISNGKPCHIACI